MNKDSTFLLIKEKYNTEVLTIFECIATYFTDIFYNHLHKEAIVFKEDSNFPQIYSITEGYKHALRAYSGAINKSNYYKESIKGIVKQLQSEFGCMVSYRESISMIVNQFVPKSWNVGSENESKILRRVFKRCAQYIIHEVAKSFIILIIDERNKKTIEKLQDSFLRILLDQKEYTESELNVNLYNQSRSQITDAETLIRFKKEFKNISIKNQKQERIINALTKIIQDKNENIDNINYKIEHLESELKQIKQKSQNIKDNRPEDDLGNFESSKSHVLSSFKPDREVRKTFETNRNSEDSDNSLDDSNFRQDFELPTNFEQPNAGNLESALSSNFDYSNQKFPTEYAKIDNIKKYEEENVILNSMTLADNLRNVESDTNSPKNILNSKINTQEPSSDLKDYSRNFKSKNAGRNFEPKIVGIKDDKSSFKSFESKISGDSDAMFDLDKSESRDKSDTAAQRKDPPQSLNQNSKFEPTTKSFSSKTFESDGGSPGSSFMSEDNTEKKSEKIKSRIDEKIVIPDLLGDDDDNYSVTYLYN